MKRQLSLCFLGLFLLSTIHARAATWPDACGDDNAVFDIATLKNQPRPTPPPPGKAQIIFLEYESAMIGPFMHAVVRFGVDGGWMGADHGNSYFAVTVNPGLHHLCADLQSGMKRNLHLTSFTAEPGKIYYFSASITAESDSYAFALTQLNEDEGKYQVTLAKLAVSKHSNSKPRK